MLHDIPAWLAGMILKSSMCATMAGVMSICQYDNDDGGNRDVTDVCDRGAHDAIDVRDVCKCRLVSCWCCLWCLMCALLARVQNAAGL